MMYLVAYDISDNDERERVASALMAMGFVRIQRSVFLGRAPRGRVADLAEAIRRIVRGRGHVIIVPVPEHLVAKRIEIGQPQFDSAQAALRPPPRIITFIDEGGGTGSGTRSRSTSR